MISCHIFLSLYASFLPGYWYGEHGNTEWPDKLIHYYIWRIAPALMIIFFSFFFPSSGPVVMNMSGYSEKGFKRKLAVQALFGKVFYLSEVNNETSVWWPFIDSYFLLQLFLALFLFSVKHNFSPYSVNLYERAWKLPFETSHSFLFCWNGCLFWEGSLILQLSFLYEIWFDIDIGIWT